MLVDDLGYHDLGFAGSRIHQTPAIDQLAADSANFADAYANYPRCIPSRYAIYTGRYPTGENTGQQQQGQAYGLNGNRIPAAENFIARFHQQGYSSLYV